MIATKERIANMTDIAAEFDVRSAFKSLDAEAGELSSGAFVRFIIERYDYTIEAAKRLIYALVDLGRIVLTPRYTLRIA